MGDGTYACSYLVSYTCYGYTRYGYTYYDRNALTMAILTVAGARSLDTHYGYTYHDR